MRSNRSTILRYVIAWLPMVLLAIINGMIREFGYAGYMSDQLAHQLSTLTLILIFSAYVWLLDKRWPLLSARQAAMVGAVWLVLTVAFELGMGLLVSGLSWQELLAAYDVTAGNVWVLVPLAVAVLPAMVVLLRRRASVTS